MGKQERVVKKRDIMATQSLFSGSWNHATDKFSVKAPNFGDLRWCVANNHSYDIPYVIIGEGSDKLVFLSGLNGCDAAYGSAAQQLFLDKFAPKLTPEFRKKYTVVLIHVVNGYGMDNQIMETVDKYGDLVHLNRNFVDDFNNKPENKEYQAAHKLLLARHDKSKEAKLLNYRKEHLNDGAWYAIANGQYTHKDGFFYGGVAPVMENKMLMSIFDTVSQDAKSVQAFCLQTGDGFYNDVYGNVSGMLQVLHSADSVPAQFYRRICWSTEVAARPHYIINGNWARAVENRYNSKHCSVFATDFFVGTKRTASLPHIQKYLCIGQERYERKRYGEITGATKQKLLNLFCPQETQWRNGAMDKTYHFFQDIINFANAQCKRR